MSNMSQSGTATIAAVVAGVTIVGAVVATPVMIDSVADQQPDSFLYGLEKAGEAIKEGTYKGGQQWNVERAKERTNEFKNMVQKGKAEKYEGLVDEAEKRLSRAASLSQDNQGVRRAMEAFRKHIGVLQQVQENLPEQARQSVLRDIERMRQGVNALENVARRIGKDIRPEKAGVAFEFIRMRMGSPESIGSSGNAGPSGKSGASENVNLPENTGPPKGAGLQENAGLQESVDLSENENVSVSKAVLPLANGLKPGVVKVNAHRPDNSGATLVGTATGFVIENRYILTCCHGVENAFLIRITTFSGDSYNAKVLATGDKKDNDVALLKVDAPMPGTKELELADPGSTENNDLVFSIGNPCKYGSWVVIAGRVSATAEWGPGSSRLSQFTSKDLVLDMPNGGGQSGAPVFNLRGEVVGLVYGKIELEDMPVSREDNVVLTQQNSGLYTVWGACAENVGTIRDFLKRSVNPELAEKLLHDEN